MNYKKTIHSCFLIIFCLLLTGINPVRAEDEPGLSVGYDALRTSKDNPKNMNIGAITARYGLDVSKELIPYVGTGLAYCYSEETKPGETSTGLKTGVAGQAGVNYLLGQGVSLSVDYKYLLLTPDAKPGPNESGAQKVCIGLDIKF